MWNNSFSDGYGMAGYGGGPGWGGYGYGGGFGGATGGAFLGGLAGGLVGDLFFDGRGRGRGHDGDGCEKVVQINNPPYGNGYGYNNEVPQWQLMKEMCDVDAHLSSQNYEAMISNLNQQIANDKSFAALQQQICCCCNETQRDILEGQYKAALQSAGISREMAECCCKQLQATTVMGFETQLRDQTNQGQLLKELAEVKCLIKDTEKDSIIRAQGQTINALELKNLKEEIICAMKPVAPVPAYIQANPYENFRPVVRVEHERRDCDCRWDFNNCRGFQ